MTEEEMAATEKDCSVSAVLPWGGKYPPGVGVVERDGFDIITPKGGRKADLHQRILSWSEGGHLAENDAAVASAARRFPDASLVDTTEYFEPRTLLMRDLHEALAQYGDYLIQLGTTGTGVNEQAIRAAMGSLGGIDKIKLLALAQNYPGAGLFMNGICDALGWKGDTSLPQQAEILALDGSNMDDVFRRCAGQGKKPILIMEDGVQGVGDFTVLDVKFLRALAERVHDSGGRTISDNVQDFVRATGGRGLFGFNRWAEPGNPKHVPDFVTMAKGLGDGCPIAVMAALRSVLEQCKTSPQGPGNTFDTFSSYRDSLARARSVLNVARRERLDINMKERGDQFRAHLEPMVDRYHGLVTHVAGLGGMTGLKFRDPEKLKAAMTNAPFAGIVVAKGALAMRLPLQFDTPTKFVDRVAGCVEDMLKRTQAQTGA